MFGPLSQLHPHPRVLVLGLGESGLAIARWAQARGATVRLADTRSAPAGLDQAREQLPEADIRCGGDWTPDLLDDIDLVGISPGLSPYHEPAQSLLAAAQARSIPVWGEIEFFARALAALKAERGYAPHVVGITGTNGKTTVTSLCVHLAQRAGLKAQAAGNISPAALDALSAALSAESSPEESLPDFWALELSSFQLETTFSLELDAAVVLNLSEDHLDWHPSREEYAQAKARIYTHARTRIANRQDAATLDLAGSDALSFGLDAPLRPGDFGVIEDNGLRWLARIEPQTVAAPSRARPKPTQEEEPLVVHRLMPADALRMPGEHNLANALAALMLTTLAGVQLASCLHGLREFVGLAHRVEFVRSVAGVDFIDDSKGTNVGATVAALRGMRRKLVLIAGGDGKGQDFSPLREPVHACARAVVLIGRDATRIEEALGASQGLVIEHAVSLDAAVARAAALARPGDAVLLSPACASLDMFRNYAHRAQVFIDAVSALAMDAGEIC